MAAPATPRRGVIGRFFGSISQLVASPRPGGTPEEVVPESAHVAPDTAPSDQAARFEEHPVLAPITNERATPDDWYPSMMKPKHISEMEKMWNEMLTPQRRPQYRKHSIVQPQTCPPKSRNAPANHRKDIEMPRSALKKTKRGAPEDDANATPSRSKRVKFNSFLEERVLSPPHSFEHHTMTPHLPDITGSKKRPRATDPYRGKEFSDSTNMFQDDPPAKKIRYQAPAANFDRRQNTPEQRSVFESSDDSTYSSDNTPITQSNTNMNETVGQKDYDDFKPSRCHPTPGTWTLDYDAYGDNDDYSDMEEDELRELVVQGKRKHKIKNDQRERPTQVKQAKEASKAQQAKHAEHAAEAESGAAKAISAIPAPPEQQQQQQQQQPSPQQPAKSSRFSLDFPDDSDMDGSSMVSDSINTTPTKPPAPAPASAVPVATKQIATTAPPPASPPRLEISNQNTTSPPSSTPSPSDPPTPPQILHNNNHNSPDSPLNLPIPATIQSETNALSWPKPTTYVEAGTASQSVVDLLDANWDDGDDYYSRLWWEREFGLFREAFVHSKALVAATAAVATDVTDRSDDVVIVGDAGQ